MYIFTLKRRKNMENKKASLGSFVVYGGTATHLLKHDTVYKVSAIYMSAKGIMYELDGVEGEFDSREFNLLPEFLLITKQIPEVGRCMEGVMVDTTAGTFNRFHSTHPIIEVYKNPTQDFYSILTRCAYYHVICI